MQSSNEDDGRAKILFRVQLVAIAVQVATLAVLGYQSWKLSEQTSAMISQTGEMKLQTDQAIAATNAMVAQTEEMQKQTEAANETKNLMAEQLEQMRIQTMAIVETNRPILSILPTKSDDVVFKSEQWVLNLNVQNSGTRPSFDSRLLVTRTVKLESRVDTIPLTMISPGSTAILPLNLGNNFDRMNLAFDLTYQRREVADGSISLQPFRLTRAITLNYNETDSSWSSKRE